MILMLVVAYLGALVVSAAHLSQLYALFNAGLPYWVSIGLAVALETVAFLFSIISTSLGKRAGPWAAPASTSALLLVWAGNGYAMMLAAPALKWYVVLAASCFVPVCTLMVGKVLGGLFRLLDELAKEERAAAKQKADLAIGTVNAQLIQQAQAVRLPVTATSGAAETPVARQTVQVRSVAAPSPARQPPLVRGPAVADDSPVCRPGTAPSAGTGDSTMTVLNTEFEDASSAAATPDPQPLAGEGTVPLGRPANPPTPSTETGDSGTPALNAGNEDTSPAAATPDLRLLPDAELPEPASSPTSPGEPGESSTPGQNIESENVSSAAATPDPQLLADEGERGTKPLTESATSPAPSAETGDSAEPGLDTGSEDASPAAATPDPRLLADKVTVEAYRNMLGAWTTKRRAQQEGGRRPSLTPEQELTLLRQYKRPWQGIIEEFNVSERRARGIAGEVKAELTARSLW